MTMDAMVPSYRVQREPSGIPWRMLAIAGGVLALGAAGAGGWWAMRSLGQGGYVPVVEADPRPFKVRPDDPGGLRVPNQGELILDRPANRAQAPAGRATMLPEAEAPNLYGLRAAVAPPPPVVPPAPVQSAAPAASPPTAAPQPAAAPEATPAAEAARFATNGRVQVQLGALNSAEAARAEWDRLSRRAPELFQGRSPQILRLDRAEGQAPLFRLRTGGLQDQEAASQFCEQIRARGGACVPVRS